MAQTIDDEGRDIPLVYIRWADSAGMSESHWRSLDQIPEIEICHTVGFLIKETEDSVVVLSTISEAGFYTGDIAIYKGCILEREEISRKGEKLAKRKQ
jgi:hypothetical protein